MIRFVYSLLFFIPYFVYGSDDYDSYSNCAEISRIDGSTLFCLFDDQNRLYEVNSSCGTVHCRYRYPEDNVVEVYDALEDKTLTFCNKPTPLEIQNKEPATFWETVASWLGLSGVYSTLSMVHNTLTFPTEDYIDVDGMMLSTFGEPTLMMAGYFPSCCDSGVIGDSEASPFVRITMMNGVLNLRHEFIDNVRWVSKEHGNNAIHYVFRPTEGWTRDIFKCLLVRNGYVSPAAEELAVVWKTLIEEMGGVDGEGLIIHYAHSIGAVESRNAHKLLTLKERKKIRLVAFGSPKVFVDDEFEQVIQYTSKRDGIILMDPSSYLFTLVNDVSHVHFIGSHAGVPLIDHFISSSTYREALEKLGNDFCDTYAK